MSSEETGNEASQAFDQLVAAMSKIAEAVKAFPESVQGKAFDALMDAYSRTAPAVASTNTEADESATTSTRRRTSRKKTSENGGTSTKRRGAGGPSIAKDLNLAPKGKQSFKDFVGDKDPQSQDDRNVASVYWLGHVAETSPITMDQVFTCYRSEGWQIPKNFRNSLATTASKKGYIDTSELPDITITAHGINRVERSLPEKSKE